jgi:hypothetical protein
MKTKKVIHVIGAASSKSHCLIELNKEIRGATLIFSYDLVLKSKKGNIETECLSWIRKQIKDHETVVTCGLPVDVAKKWIQRAYPDEKFIHVVWEVHHSAESEKMIVNERSWTYLMDGIEDKGREALRRGIPADHELIKHTPLKIAMDFVSRGNNDVINLCQSIAKQQEAENSVHVREALICREAFITSYRNSCISLISRFICNHQQPRGRA